MIQINRRESGWLVALSWLSAIEETARDFHGTRPKRFCERVYEHTVAYYLGRLSDEYGLQIPRTYTIRGTVEQYIKIGISGGLFRSEGDFELVDVHPSRLEITVHNCEYLKSCQSLMDGGFTVKDLTCARIGCFRAAVKALAHIDCEYQVQSFNVDGDCHGSIERI
jgi:hypothetical protein